MKNRKTALPPMPPIIILMPSQNIKPYIGRKNHEDAAA
jgi:hypothetical protein